MKKKLVWVLVATAVLALIAFVPLPESVLHAGGAELTSDGRFSFGVLIFCLILWVSEPMPFHITGLVGLLLTALKVEDFQSIVKPGFGSDTVIFFIGVLTISACIMSSGLGKRISMFVLSKTGNKTSSIILGFLVTGALLSMWLTAMAVAAMLTPIAKSLLEDEGFKPLKSNFGRALMISCAWGPLIGGIGTPAGCGPNQIAISFIKDMLGIEISFFDWMTYGIPCVTLLLLPAWGLLIWIFKPEVAFISKSKKELSDEFKNLPAMCRNEKAAAVIFTLTVFLWIVSPTLGLLTGKSLPTSMPALLGACLFFLPGVTNIKWGDVQKQISWSGVILIASGISMGLVLYKTGAAEWLSHILFSNLTGLHPIALILILVLLISLIKVGLSSNTVTASVIIPLLIAMTKNSGISALEILIPASLTLSLAFILVTSTPTSVIPYSAGYFSIPDMAKAGAVMTVVTSVVMSLAIYGIGLLNELYKTV